MVGPAIGYVIGAFLFTSCLCLVGGLFLFLGVLTTGNHRISKSLCAFAVSVCINLISGIVWETCHNVSSIAVWKSLTVVSLLLLLASMIIVHLESGPGKRIVLIGTTVQCAIYVLGFLLFQFG